MEGQDYNQVPVTEFLCRYFGVQRPQDIVPFCDLKNKDGKFCHRITTWELMSDVVVEATLRIPNAVFPAGSKEGVSVSVTPQALHSPLQVKGTYKGYELDWDNAAIYGFTSPHHKVTVPIPVAARLTFQHKGVAVVQNEIDKIYQAATKLPAGTFSILYPTGEAGKDEPLAPLNPLETGVSNDSFVASTALVTEYNLENGIVHLPREVCIAAGLVMEGLPMPPKEMLEREGPECIQRFQKAFMEHQCQVFRVDDYSKVPQADHCVAIPVTHTLFWPFRSEAYCKARNIIPGKFFRVFNPEQNREIPLFMIIEDWKFRAMCAGYARDWLNKTDIAPLGTRGLEFFPIWDHPQYPVPEGIKSASGHISMRVYLKMMVPPKGLNRTIVSQLAPSMRPNFLHPDEFVTQGGFQ